MKKIIALGVVFLTSFNLAHAVVLTGSAPISGGTTNATVLAQGLAYYFDVAIQLILVASVVWVTWNIFKFIMSAGDEEARGKAREGIIYGIIGVAVMVSVWGLVNFITGTTGVGTGTRLNAPSVGV